LLPQVEFESKNRISKSSRSIAFAFQDVLKSVCSTTQKIA